MKNVIAGLMIFLLIAAAASARVRTIAPPGNSAVNQYVENIPTANGNRPTSTVHPGGGVGSGGSGGGGRGLSAPTEHAFAKRGRDGASAAALANATAPANGPAAGGSGAGGSGGSSGTSSSPLATLLKAATGSSSHGGLGPSLPVILIVIAFGGAALGLRRRRAT
jgi:hypothetical protein